MSPSIWTHCAEHFELGRLERHAWRAVEDQSVNATRQLVDSDAEQAALEELIDGVKPPWPDSPRLRGLHYLLRTPFRYPPLRHGSRFGTRGERGIFYAAETKPTVLAEKAYYQLVFLEGTHARFARPVTQSLTLFRVGIATGHGADLTLPPFAEFEALISSKTSYGASQPLGKDLRAFGVEVIAYRSARDPERGRNFALLEPAFRPKKLLQSERWICTSSRERIELKPGLGANGTPLSWPRGVFEHEGALPLPGVTPNGRS
jgi:hypothetical protein